MSSQPDTAPADRDDWMRRAGPLFPVLVALRMLTRVPVMTAVEFDARDRLRASLWYPAIGALVGFVMWLLAKLCMYFDLIPAVAAIAVVICAIVSTGALYERGIGRVVDRFITGDSYRYDDPSAQLSTWGALTIAATLSVRVVLLLAIRPQNWLAALVISQVVLHWAPLLLSKVGDALESSDELQVLLIPRLSWNALGTTSGIAFAATVVMARSTGVIVIGIVLGVALACGLFFQKRDGGLGHHAIAASSLVCEVSVLLVFASAWPSLMSPWTAS